jgi:hypothetical protein
MYIVKQLLSTSLLRTVCRLYLSTPVKMSIERVYLEVTIAVRTPHTLFSHLYLYLCVINLNYYLQDTTSNYTDLTMHRCVCQHYKVQYQAIYTKQQ